MKKRWTALILAGVMSLSALAGCGTKEEETAKKSETPVSEEKIDVLNQEEKMRMSVVCLQ